MLLASSLLSPEPLHIPDGFLSTPVALVGWALVIVLVGYALRMTREQLGERQVPLMGILAAFTGYLVYRGVQRLLGNGRRSALLAGFAGSWLSVMVGASATAIELAVSGTSPLSVGLPAMAGIHALIGIGEGLITVAALAFISQTRPDLLDFGRAATGSRSASWIWAGLVLALGVAALSPLASSSPDGLEWVAGEQGFLARGLEPLYEVLPDYTVPLIENEAVTTIVAGAIGTLVVFGVTYSVARLRRGRRETQV
jgi:cobalt/nickel transport system permease protein